MKAHVAQTGSEYHRVQGVTFRISDHSQPSHYQAKEYYDIKRYEDIERITSNELFSFYANPIKNENGFFDAQYDEKRDGFNMVKITEKEYNKLVLKMKEKKHFMINNGYKGVISF